MSRGATARRRHAGQKAWKITDHAQFRCAEFLHSHLIPRGTWALFWAFRPGLPRFILCEAHANALGYVRPTPAAPAGPDVKMKQAGEP